MKLLLLFALCVAVLAYPAEVELQNMFSLWAGEHHKVYANEDMFTRYNIWTANYKFIEDTNNEKHDYTLKMNEFGDLTLDEFAAAHLKLTPKKTQTASISVKARIPDTIDWRTSGAVTPVKDQGQCGSCWAFSAVAAIESRCWIKHHPAAIDVLSEQELVDCSGPEGNEGCNGGWMDQAFDYVKKTGGLASSKDYPYVAYDQKCKGTGKKHWCKVTGWTDITKNNQMEMKTAVADGPISVAIEADTSVFQFYSSGVIDSSACGTTLDHGVAVVGYGKNGNKDMWIVKNSWGKSWGMSGYVLIKRNDAGKDAGICGIASAASYPIIGDHE